jgi:purine-nucleoside/S-methyl-5'-thioadenosine phosphorylase / adenosine deaminase
MMFAMTPQPNDGFEWVQAAGGPALRCAALAPLADHLFTTRPWRLGSSSPGSKDEGWPDVAAALRVDPPHLARLHQVHGAAFVVAAAGGGEPPPFADIHLTRDADLALAVQTADCLPILLADPRTGAVAAAHAGWRGLAARVPEVAVAALAERFGCHPGDLVAAVGPSIGACCYEVGADVRDATTRAGFSNRELERWFFEKPQPNAVNPSMPAVSTVRREHHWFFDAWAAARAQLERAGVPPDRIHVAALCSASHPDLFCSYRRDGRPAGRMAAAIRARSLG